MPARADSPATSESEAFLGGFTKAPNALLVDARVTDAQLRVYLAVRSIAGEKGGSCWRTDANIGRRAGAKGERATRTALKALVHLGLIAERKVKRSKKNPTGRAYSIPAPTSTRQVQPGFPDATRQNSNAGVRKDPSDNKEPNSKQNQGVASAPPPPPLSRGREEGRRRRKSPTPRKPRDPTPTTRRRPSRYEPVPLAEDPAPPPPELIEERRRQLLASIADGSTADELEFRALHAARARWAAEAIESLGDRTGPGADATATRIAVALGDVANKPYYLALCLAAEAKLFPWAPFAGPFLNVMERIWSHSKYKMPKNPGAYFVGILEGDIDQFLMSRSAQFPTIRTFDDVMKKVDDWLASRSDEKRSDS